MIQKVSRSSHQIRDDAALKEYIKALVITGRLDSSDVLYLIRSQNRSPSTASFPALMQTPTMVDGEGRPVSMHMNTFDPFNISPGSSASSPSSSSNKTISEESRVQITNNAMKLGKQVLVALLGMATLSLCAEEFADKVSTREDSAKGKSTNQPVEAPSTRFSDVKGCDSVKEEVQEIVEYLRNPEQFTRLGAKLPKGVLLSGPPGTGKTLIARAMAGEAGVKFFQASGSDFEEMYVGVGAKRVRDLFASAREAAPCIVFIDEIDAVAGKRSSRDSSSVRQTVNQLLVELDGFSETEGIVVVCATNFAESLDPALTRPGRLDKVVEVPLPDQKGRLDILKLYADKLVLEPGMDLESLSRRTGGLAGADLANLLNLAAVKASRQGKECITLECVEDSLDRVLVGLELKTEMSKEELTLTAYHEGGHTLTALLQPDSHDPIHKATILARGRALGITWSAPKSEKMSQKTKEFRARLVMAMGGKAAEELIFGFDNVTSGCSSDLKQATQVARRMVMEFGMCIGESDMTGKEQRNLLLAPIALDVESYASLSEAAKQEIDKEVNALLRWAYKKAYALLKDKKVALEHLALCLLEFETLDADEIEIAIKYDTHGDKGLERAKKEIKELRNKKEEERKSKDDENLKKQAEIRALQEEKKKQREEETRRKKEAQSKGKKGGGSPKGGMVQPVNED